MRRNQLMAVQTQTEPGFSFETPEMLFQKSFAGSIVGRNYDVGPDRRFIMIKTGAPPPPHISVLLNWQELLERVPVP